MPLYLNDDTADTMLAKVMELSGKTNKTRTIVDLLRQELNRLENVKPPSQRIERFQSAVDALEPGA